VIAGISTVSDTIRDRSLSIKMVRKSPKERTARLNMRKERKTFDALRSSMTLWAEQNDQAVETIYDNLPDEPALDGCDDRFLDIVEPLLSIIKFADAETVNGTKRIADEIMPLLKELGGQRAEAQADDAIAALCSLLDTILDGTGKEVFVASADLLERTKQTPGLQWIGSTKALASFMSKLDIVSRPKWMTLPDGPGTEVRKQIRGYVMNKEILDDIKLRYADSIPSSEASHVSQVQAQSGSEGIS
jgi:hypothetical protein